MTWHARRQYVIFKVVPSETDSTFILPIEILGQGFEPWKSSWQWYDGSGMRMYPRVGKPSV